MDVTATISGNLAADPRLSHLPDGTPACELRVLVNRRRMTADGWQKLPARAYTVTAFGDLARNTAESASKGDRVTVTCDDIWSDAWTGRDTGEAMSAVKVRASELSLSLRFATGTATRIPASGDDSPADTAPRPALASVPAN